MAAGTRTAFDRYVTRRRRDATFNRAFQQASAEILAVDEFVRALEAARVNLGMTKAELARRIGSNPAAVRRLLSARRANPTLNTMIALASALGLSLRLSSSSKSRQAA